MKKICPIISVYTEIPDVFDNTKDLRFRRLLSPAAWAGLPEAVRRRFSKHLAPDESVTYAGRVLDCRMSFAGLLLAQAARLIGAPLPLDPVAGGAAVVTVTADHGGGQVWTRAYVRPRGFPQVIHSAKRFDGPTGLSEYLGRGVSIALDVEAVPRGLRFTSAGYQLTFGGRTVTCPRWLTPGKLVIDHLDHGDSSFLFQLTLTHSLLGRLIHQSILFAERRPETDR